MKKYVALYIRVSTLDKQTKGMQSQEKALLEYCKNHNLTNIKIYKDMVSGAEVNNRPQLKKMQEDIFLGKINTVCVWKLDRLSRSLRDGINLLVDMLDRGIRVVSISQQFDFSGSVGKLIASVLLGIAEMERQNIRENIRRGMQNAKAKGVKIGGSKPKITADDVLPLKAKGMSVSAIARELQCSRQTVYSALERK